MGSFQTPGRNQRSLGARAREGNRKAHVGCRHQAGQSSRGCSEIERHVDKRLQKATAGRRWWTSCSHVAAYPELAVFFALAIWLWVGPIKIAGFAVGYEVVLIPCRNTAFRIQSAMDRNQANLAIAFIARRCNRSTRSSSPAFSASIKYASASASARAWASNSANSARRLTIAADFLGHEERLFAKLAQATSGGARGAMHQAVQVCGEPKLEYPGVHPDFRTAGVPQLRRAFRV